MLFLKIYKNKLNLVATPYADAQTKLQDYISRYDLKGGFIQPDTQTRTTTYFEDVLDDDGKIRRQNTKDKRSITIDTHGATLALHFDSTQIGDFQINYKLYIRYRRDR